MKKIGLLLLSTLFLFAVNAQEETKKDTTKITIGKSTILIISPNAEDIEVVAGDEKKDDKFKGHWFGVDLGLNGYLNSDHTTFLELEDKYLDLNSGKSWGVGINIIEKSIGLHKDRIGIVTGLGLEANNYRFSNDVVLMSDSIENLYALETDIQFEKNKLVVTYLTLPLLFEFQFPVGKKDKRIFISAGGIGGLKIGSHTKYVFQENGKTKNKMKEDFHLSPFKYGLTFRMGYSGLNLFANYNLSQLFDNNEGPELYPFMLGISFSF